MSYVLNLQAMENAPGDDGPDSTIVSTVSLSVCLVSTFSVALCITVHHA